MICGTWKKNLVGGLLILAISCLSALFFSHSSAFASLSDLSEIQVIYNPDWRSWETDPLTGGTPRYNFSPTFGDHIEPNGSGYVQWKNSNTNTFTFPQGLTRQRFKTTSFVPTDNTAVFHIQINLVAGNLDGNANHTASQTYLYRYLDSLALTYCNHTVVSSNISYVVTPWQTTFQVGSDLHYANLDTLTVYLDLVIGDLTSSSTDLTFSIGLTDNQFLITQNVLSKKFGLYTEQYNFTRQYFHNYDDAILQQQMNILQSQTIVNNAMLEQQQQTNQYLEQQIDQDQADRDNVSSVSSDATADGNNATSSARNATTSLLSAITGIYGTFLNPTVTNCNIGPINIYDQLNLGTLNFCSDFPMPSAIWNIGALVGIGIVVLLGWSVLRAGMSLYKDLFGGK